MHGKILKSGDQYVLRYKSKDIEELRRMGRFIWAGFNIDFVEGP